MKPSTDMKPVQPNTVLVAIRYLKVLCPQISLNGIRAFLYIAENPGINIVELSQVADFTLSTASRIARALGPVGVEGSLPPYLGLIDIFINPDYAGGRILYVSERGRDACLRLDAIIRTPVAIFGSAGCSSAAE